MAPRNEFAVGLLGPSRLAKYPGSVWKMPAALIEYEPSNKRWRHTP